MHILLTITTSKVYPLAMAVFGGLFSKDIDDFVGTKLFYRVKGTLCQLPDFTREEIDQLNGKSATKKTQETTKWDALTFTSWRYNCNNFSGEK